MNPVFKSDYKIFCVGERYLLSNLQLSKYLNNQTQIEQYYTFLAFSYFAVMMI